MDQKTIIEDLSQKNELLENESKLFQAIFHSIPHPTIIYNKNGKIIHANSRAREIFHARNSSVHDSKHKENEISTRYSFLINPVGRFIIEDQSEREFDVKVNTLVGEKYFNVNLRKFLDVSGELDHIMCLLKDMTKIYELNREKESMRTQLFFTSKMASMNEMVSGLSHELMNPMAIVSGFMKVLEAHLLHGKHSQDKIKSLFEGAHIALNRMSDLVAKLRLSTRKSNMNKKYFDLHQCIRESVELMRPTLNLSNVNIEFDLKSTSSQLLGVPTQMQQILSNLITNAIESMGAKEERKIKISTEMDEGLILVTVEDTGEGISPDKYETIFQSFYTTKDVGKAVGLGLTLAYELVKSMQGDIDVSSVKGEGTSFYLRFPIADERSEREG